MKAEGQTGEARAELEEREGRAEAASVLIACRFITARKLGIAILGVNRLMRQEELFAGRRARRGSLH